MAAEVRGKPNSMRCEECQNQLIDVLDNTCAVRGEMAPAFETCATCRRLRARLEAGLRIATLLPSLPTPRVVDFAILQLASRRRPEAPNPGAIEALFALAALAFLAVLTSLPGHPAHDGSTLSIEGKEIPPKSHTTMAGAGASRPDSVPRELSSPEARRLPARGRSRAEDRLPTLRGGKQTPVPDLVESSTRRCKARTTAMQDKLADDPDYPVPPEEALGLGVCFGILGEPDVARSWLRRAATDPSTQDRANAVLDALE